MEEWLDNAAVLGFRLVEDEDGGLLLTRGDRRSATRQDEFGSMCLMNMFFSPYALAVTAAHEDGVFAMWDSAAASVAAIRMAPEPE